jgi:hypothetical protein
MHLSNKLAIVPLILSTLSLVCIVTLPASRSDVGGVLNVMVFLAVLFPTVCFTVPFAMDYGLVHGVTQQDIENGHKAPFVAIGYLVWFSYIYHIY